MQTKEQFIKKFLEMADQVRNHLLYRAEFLLKSGAINLPSFDDDYQLPKIVLTAALEYEADQWRPHDKKMRAKVKNLSYF